MEITSLNDFPSEVLLQIFSHLDIYELAIVRQTCKRFCDIIDKWGHTFSCIKEPLVTNQCHPVMIQRSFRILKRFKRFRVSENWKRGIYREGTYLGSIVGPLGLYLGNREKYVPWLQLQKELLWFARGQQIKAYKRNYKGINWKCFPYIVKKGTEDISRFVVRDDFMLAGELGGRVWIKSLANDRDIILKEIPFSMNDCVHSLDLGSDLAVVGLRNSWVELYRWRAGTMETRINVYDTVWSVALCPSAPKLAVGTAAIGEQNSIKIIDVSRPTYPLDQKLDEGCRRGSGVLDLKWETPSLLWGGGYDGVLRLWDLRTGCAEQTFSDPHGSSVYCFDYDFRNTIITGTQGEGRAVLWDTRQKDYVQMYFMECCKGRLESSPIYSLSFDAEFLFAATDAHLSALNFSTRNAEPKDYSNMFFK